MPEQFPEALKPYRFHGAFDREGPWITSGRDYVGTCPFCGKERSFVVHAETGQYTCHSKHVDCGRSGNVSIFLRDFAAECHETMTGPLWRRLQKKRQGIPADAFKPWEVGYDPNGRRFTVPIFNERGKIVDCRVYPDKDGVRKMGTAGCKAGCFNINVAAKFEDKDEATILIAEGEWDAMALDWLLRNAKVDFPFVVIGLPGAKVLKDGWVDVIKKFGRVLVCGDNDSDGDAMAEKVWRKLCGFKNVKIQYLNWPDTYPDKYDLTDHIAKGFNEEQTSRKIWKSVYRLIDDEARRMPFKGQEDVETAAGKSRERTVERPDSNPTFEKTVEVFSHHLKMTAHHVLALQFCYAIYLATQWDDDPLWGFLVGAPSAGKSALLCSIDGCPEAVFYSSMQSKALVSGFKADPDPSLIPEMIGNCAVFKDWTELLQGNQFALEETYGTLRGWYDGEVKRKFGNGVERHYIGRGNILAGVTNVIHAQNQTILGERFLKFQLPKPPKKQADDMVMEAMLGTTQQRLRDEELKAASLAFLNRDVPALIPAEVIPLEFLKRIRALAFLIAILRAKVEYSGYGTEKELSHRPESEFPMRLAKQLTKLAMANMLVLNRKKVDERTFRLVERVAFNTAYGFHLDVLQAMFQLNGGREILVEDMAEAANMPRQTIQKRLEDMTVLGVLKKTSYNRGQTGRPPSRFTIVPSIRKLWDEANVVEDHTREAVEARRGRGGGFLEADGLPDRVKRRKVKD